MNDEKLRKFFVEVDSLLSFLVHRHRDYLNEIGGKELASKLYVEAREYSKI